MSCALSLRLLAKPLNVFFRAPCDGPHNVGLLYASLEHYSFINASMSGQIVAAVVTKGVQNHK